MARLIQFLLIFIVISVIWRALKKYVFPLVFRKAADNLKSKMEQRMRETQSASDGRQEGEIRVEKPASSSSSNQRPMRMDDGEYVDFEEVE